MKVMNQEVTLIKIATATKDRPAGYMVKIGERVIGFLDKYKNTRTETHPWKAFAAKYNSETQSFVYAGEIAFKCFYNEDGGKEAAIAFLIGRKS